MRLAALKAKAGVATGRQKGDRVMPPVTMDPGEGVSMGLGLGMFLGSPVINE